jgi:hypothetical protein
VRLKFARGWVSVTSAKGLPLLELVATEPIRPSPEVVAACLTKLRRRT